MENLENNNKIEQKTIPVNPAFNVVTPSGLNERVAQKKSQHSKKRVGAFITLVILFVLAGVGGWWYFAQGQVLLLLKQAKWDWGSENLENYQQNMNFSLEFSNISNKKQDIGAMFFSGEKFKLNIDSENKIIGLNLESDGKLKVDTGDFNLALGLELKKIDSKFYIKPNVKDLLDLIGNFLPIEDFDSIIDFDSTWLEIDIEDFDIEERIGKDIEYPYNFNGIKLDKEQILEINKEFNKFLDLLRDEKVFEITDLKKDENGFRKIQLNVREDKMDDLILMIFTNTIDVGKIMGLEVDKKMDDIDQNSLREKWAEDFEKIKSEEPENWAKIKKVFNSINFVILVNQNTKIIQGIELYINDMVMDSEDSSAIINANIKYLIKKIDYYDIEVPVNTKTAKEVEDIITSLRESDNIEQNNLLVGIVDSDFDGLSDIKEYNVYGTDINNPDSDGDGYLDGDEVNNGYDPLGDGLLDLDNLKGFNTALEQGSQAVCEYTKGIWVNGECKCPEGISLYENQGCIYQGIY